MATRIFDHLDAGVRASVARLEEERKASDARRLGWDPELTGGEE